jgi:hypothetical protein
MEEKTKLEKDLPCESKVEEKVEHDPESFRKLELAKRITERYSDALQRLADS